MGTPKEEKGTAFSCNFFGGVLGRRLLYETDRNHQSNTHSLTQFGNRCLFDWQFCQAGNGIFDIAFFLSLSVGTKVLEENEVEFLKLYHTTLVENGVKDYDEKAMHDEYKIGLATSWAIIVYVTSLLASKGPEWDVPIRVASQRTIKACERTQAVEHVLQLLAHDFTTNPMA